MEGEDKSEQSSKSIKPVIHSETLKAVLSQVLDMYIDEAYLNVHFKAQEKMSGQVPEEFKVEDAQVPCPERPQIVAASRFACVGIMGRNNSKVAEAGKPAAQGRAEGATASQQQLGQAQPRIQRKRRIVSGSEPSTPSAATNSTGAGINKKVTPRKVKKSSSQK